MTAITDPEMHAGARKARSRAIDWWYLGAMVLGAILIVIAATNQPFNQNEIRQIKPYGSDNIAEITSGTRQPPLGPLLGALFHHLLGMGQLQQRLVPVLSGIGALVVMALLLRRLRLGGAGAFGLWLMATAPLLLRYSAYTRPYMLPLFLMLLFVFSAQRWIDDRHKSALVTGALAAVALPLSRVPEPIVFLASSAVVLCLATWLKRFVWKQTLPLVAILVGALVFAGYPMYRALASDTARVYDTSLSGMIERFSLALDNLSGYALPLVGDWLPWWPVTVVVAIAALLVPASRRRLVEWWWFLLPLFLGPVIFMFAYHFLNPYTPYIARPYSSRYATFFLPTFVFLAVALASSLTVSKITSQRLRMGLAVLLGLALVGQLPATTRVLVENEAADYAQVADVLTTQLPDDAIVLYDTPSPIGRWRQPFSARPWYMGKTPYVGQMTSLNRILYNLPESGPVYFLMLDGECSYSTACNVEPEQWETDDVRGWEVLSRFDKFTLYQPTEQARGRAGVIKATRAFGEALGPRLGFREMFLAAKLLKKEGRPRAGKAVIREMYAKASPDLARQIRNVAASRDLDPFDK